MLLLIALSLLLIAVVTATPASPASAMVPDVLRVAPNFHVASLATHPARTETYKVRSGDTLSAIGTHFDRSWQQLAGANNLADPNLILVGQVLKIPAASYAAPATFTAVLGGTRSQPGTTTTRHSFPPAPSLGAPNSFQSCVEFRESTDGAGSSNLYGILPSTWSSLGLSGSPYTASPTQQNAAFQQLYDRDGVSPWAPYDGC